jgi:hypothetical protein
MEEAREESFKLLKPEGLKSIVVIDLKGGHVSIDCGDMRVSLKGGKGSLTDS